MNVKKIIKSKKFKNVFTTVCEIIIVAAIIFGGLMFVQNYLESDSENKSDIENEQENVTNTSGEQIDAGSDKYTIQVNIKKKAVIVYQYSSDEKSTKPYKVFNCSTSSKIKTGKYKISSKYTWLNINDAWHKYNTQFSDSAWFQSADYSEKYSWTMNYRSYEAIGKKQDSGSCIILTAEDAKWISDKCSEGTEVKIVKGSKKDKLPLQPAARINIYRYCGWDPTDPDKSNPYKKRGANKITAGSDTVYVERGHKVKYIENLIALDENAKNVAGKLKYKKFNSDETGTHKVEFSYKKSDGKKLKCTVKFKVIDTTPPKVSVSSGAIICEVDSKKQEDISKSSVKSEIESKVRARVSCNEPGSTITIETLVKEELKIGDNAVKVVAVDASGNIGSTDVVVEIKAKEKKLNSKYNKNKHKKIKKKKEEKTTKKPKKKKTDKKKKEEATTESETTKEAVVNDN